MRNTCNSCKKKLLVEPVGPLGAEILLVGEFPGYEEIRAGSPFVGRTGDVLKEELNLVGIQFLKCRMTNLWLHEKDTDCDLGYHIQNLVLEMRGRKYVLLMGSDVTKTLLGKGVMEVSGLVVTSPYIPDDITAVACPNPASVFKGRVGEVRMAMKKFAMIVRGDKNV